MNQTVETLGAELAIVNEAILAAYTGKEFEIQSGGSAGGSRRKLVRQDLPTLLARRGELEAQIAHLSGLGRSRVNHGVIVG